MHSGYCRQQTTIYVTYVLNCDTYNATKQNIVLLCQEKTRFQSSISNQMITQDSEWEIGA